MNPDVVRARLAQIKTEIDELYWHFTRQRRGKPPILVRPDLYEERARLKEHLKGLRPCLET